MRWEYRNDEGKLLCCWCSELATHYCVMRAQPERRLTATIDPACKEHAKEWAHTYDLVQRIEK